MTQKPLILSHIYDLLENQDLSELENHLNTWFPIDLADLIEHVPPHDQFTIFKVLNYPLAVKTFEYLPFKTQQKIISFLPSEQAAYILNDLSPDDRTAFLEELPPSTLNELLKLLSPLEKAVTLKLLGYPENSVGRLMTTDYLAVKIDWTVQHVLDYIRENGRDSETINVIYIIDDQGKLLDDLRIREFLLVPAYYKVKDLADYKYISLSVYDDDEKAINMFRKYNRVALPVVDANQFLLGMVTFDDILALANEESTEDIQKIGGTEALTEPYMQTPFVELMRKRVGWLVILFLGEMLTATAMGYFQEEIAKAVVLSLFIPLIISSGGNSGSQASTLIIRALALGEVTLKDWWRIMRREIMAGIFLGSVLGLIGFLRIATWSAFSSIYGPHWFLVGMTVGTALVGVVTWGTFSGSMLPMLLQRLGMDPATSSTPFVATLVDVTGLIIYFTIAILILNGTLL